MISEYHNLIRHLRIPFSVLLLPVFLFAASAVENFEWTGFWLAFVILHLLVYPASNGYNSLMDRDTDSIGGLKNPPPVPPGMFLLSITLNVLALIITLWWSQTAFWALLAYIGASKAYSWRGIRLKRYPVIGFLVVVVLQGAAIFYFSVCMLESVAPPLTDLPLQYSIGMLLSSLMIASSYPLTQVYQHEQDRKDGVLTISRLLGVRGTFTFSLVILIFFIILLFTYIGLYARLLDIIIFLFCTSPVTIHFLKWFREILNDEVKADYNNSMKMSFLGALGMNLFFSWLLIASQIL